MFFRRKTTKGHTYLQIVENRREEGKVKQTVVATLGRLDALESSGQLDGLLRSGARFAESVLVLSAHEKGELTKVASARVGPGLVFERLWEETGCKAEMARLLRDRGFGFSVERALFLTVVHRLMSPGSDRAASKWRASYALTGTQDLELHQLYRAMSWLGAELPEGEQAGRTPFAPRCTKDLVEEGLFARRRDLLTTLDLVFFDTTSIYFEGEGGLTLGEYGNSKDSRPDLKQMVVGAVVDGEGRPIACELWPGNTTDVKTLVPIVERLQKRFAIGRICVVADRGMISAKTLGELNRRGWLYILGARMRSVAEVRDEVLSRAGRYEQIHPKGTSTKDPSPLKVKQVMVWDRRYVVCLHEDQAKKDAADRQAILAGLGAQLKKGDKALVGNKGYRKYLKSQGARFEIDEDKIREESRYDGKWVLLTNTDLPTREVALKYKQLWMVEDIFRSAKTLLETRPIFHKRDETIRGHVFCSFLALVLRKELQDRLEAKGHDLEWADVIRDLDALEETIVEQEAKRFVLRSEVRGTCGAVFQSVGVAIPPTVRQVGAPKTA
ncbi:MAG: IS1634 family transposase [Deferrisomatales bacterium]|nr:IS1634 family transposase [Deferrisomatales bacterium]